MSAWRKRAIECLPESRKEFEAPSTSIYGVFMELLPATIAAHQNKDQVLLKQYYDFAAWCFSQKSKDLWNAAGVSFYEHLGDRTETLQAMHLWVSRDIYLEIRELLKQRLDDTIMKELDGRYAVR
ncbi:hypothetical protein AAFN85_21515 [Mucilaginibacter sp. CAU 1740]|uniref:DUF7674 family protein n=1 Tax=Mucilaginibacter sp. CAU 1740 TaxID=3140365 RepID=UPI00325AA392